ncbi:MAG: type-F conjugative transfer system pilin assembly protein TraF [Alphaproteobacteria bacterium]|nr:type-F conjugative transfer system pilin assembly protein TraF [Alphaproteobacteria bacterium]
MQSSNPQQAFICRNLVLTILAVLLGSFNNLPSLKADSQNFPTAHQKDGLSSSSKDALPYHLDNPLRNKKKAQLSNHSSNQLSFFQKRAEGWHWYQSLRDNKIEERKTEEEKKGYGLSPSSAQTPTEKIEAQRKQLETKLHTAILEPSQHNIITYILAQKALMDQSQRFSEAWKQVVLTTPSLDETLIHPIDQNARHIYYDEQRRELSKKIQGLAQEYGLFFFFRKNCPYCHQFAPIVKRFTNKYGWSALGISLDGGSLPEFPHAKRDNGISERLGITHVPALIALHPQTGKLIPLAYGMISETEIEERIELLVRGVHSERVKK